MPALTSLKHTAAGDSVRPLTERFKPAWSACAARSAVLSSGGPCRDAERMRRKRMDAADDAEVGTSFLCSRIVGGGGKILFFYFFPRDELFNQK